MTDHAEATPPAERRRLVRLLSLGAGGTLAVASRVLDWPRWIGLSIMIATAMIWLASGFESHKPGETEALRRQRMRNLAIGLSLAGLVLLFYVATMARLGGNVFNKPI